MRNLLATCSLLLLSATLTSATLTGATLTAQTLTAQTLTAQTLTAQTKSTGGVLMLAQPTGQNCPVGFSARHTGSGAMLSVSPKSRPQLQGYNITFQPRAGLGVAEAKLTLHGISGPHLRPANGNTDGATATESFTVSPSSGENHRFHSVVYVQKLTGVDWIELNEVTYADGTQWHESADAPCRVVPNGFMLVANTK